MSTERIVEISIVTGLFVGQLVLWRIKRRRLIADAGVDPEVFGKSRSPVQRYFGNLVLFLRLAIVLLVVLHAIGPANWALLLRLAALDGLLFDVLGGAMGLAGLVLCAIAQRTMSASWRVGIDENGNTDLVTHGVFRWVRNPTYAGLHVTLLGVWIVWPSCAIAFYAVFFFVVMELQVRHEEEHLETLHGDNYKQYVEQTKRYVPGVY